MFLAKAGKYEPCGIFTFQHIILIIITLFGVCVALKNTINKNKEEIRKIIRNCTIAMWISEVIVISFKLSQGSFRNLNEYVPLYYCSLLLYAGLFSSFGKGKIKRMGDVFLATGGIIGGLVFIIFPTTSLLTYPMLHLISLRSFLFHGIMVYLGLLINITDYIELEEKDIIYYANMVGVICILAFIVNNRFGSNLMFISQNFPGTIIEILYKMTGKFFTPIMIIGQMTLPFICVFFIRKKIKEKMKKVDFVVKVPIQS